MKKVNFTQIKSITKLMLLAFTLFCTQFNFLSAQGTTTAALAGTITDATCRGEA